MRFRNLRRALQQIVLVGLPASQVGCGIIGDCESILTRTMYIATPAAPATQFRIDRCRVDLETCPELCRLAMDNAGLTHELSDCDVAFDEDQVVVDVAYTVYTGGIDCPVDGRRPSGLVQPDRIRSPGAAGAWLAQAAWLEAASVYAFAHLARELEQLAAPAGLVRGALAAACDELRHTELMTRLALRYGARPPTAVVVVPARRSLAELAVENAAEGCVRETWGAVMALWQSHTARDPVVRAGFGVIARDEARHAALAWAIDRWIQPQLDADARERVSRARELAAIELLEGHSGPPVPELGIPHGLQARELVSRAHHTLWSGGAA